MSVATCHWDGKQEIELYTMALAMLLHIATSVFSLGVSQGHNTLWAYLLMCPLGNTTEAKCALW